MNENTVDYILGELAKQHRLNGKVKEFANRADETFKTIGKAISAQSKLNKTVIVAAVACAGYSYFNNKKIKELDDKIKELKQLKGE